MSSPIRNTETAGQVLARRLREVRTRRGWSQEELARRVSAAGYEIHRLTIAKIEKAGTRAANASITEVLALAAALNVAPVHLLVPLEDDAVVAIVPGNEQLVRSALDVRRWVRGGQQLDETRDAREWALEMPESEVRAMWASVQAGVIVASPALSATLEHRPQDEERTDG